MRVIELSIKSRHHRHPQSRHTYTEALNVVEDLSLLARGIHRKLEKILDLDAKLPACI